MGKRLFQVLVFPFRMNDGRVQYAIFKRADDLYWQGIAGGGEMGETPLAAAKRESREEAGVSEYLPYVELTLVSHVPAEAFTDLDDPLVDELRQYAFGVLVDEETLGISEEHLEYRWVDYGEACELLRWENNKIALCQLHQRLAMGDVWLA